MALLIKSRDLFREIGLEKDAAMVEERIREVEKQMVEGGERRGMESPG